MAGRHERGKLERVLVGLGVVALVVLTVLAVTELASVVEDLVSGDDQRDGARDSADRIGQVIATRDLDDSDGVVFVRSVMCDAGSGDPGLTIAQADAARARPVLVSQLRHGGWHGRRTAYGERFVKDFDGWSGVIAVSAPPEGTAGPLEAYVTVGGSTNDDCAVFKKGVGKLLRDGTS